MIKLHEGRPLTKKEELRRDYLGGLRKRSDKQEEELFSFYRILGYAFPWDDEYDPGCMGYVSNDIEDDDYLKEDHNWDAHES